MTTSDSSGTPLASARTTFSQFQTYSLAYLTRRDRLLSTASAAPLSWLTYATQWEWLPPLYPGTAFESTACLSRSFAFSVPPSLPSETVEEGILNTVGGVTEVAEEAVAEMEEVARETVTVHQAISWSKIWRLPVLYFHAHTAGGQPVALSHLTRVGIVHSSGTLPHADGADDVGEHEVDTPATPISVADHPRTGLPTYFLHPCHTETALQSLLLHRHDQHPIGDGEGEGGEQGWTYLSAFVNLCSSAVEMRAC